MAYTPGPWEAVNGEITTKQIDGRSYRRIAAVQDYGVGSLKEVDEANARLIAAAPEMLSLLRECSAALEDLLPHFDRSGLECQEQWACVAECREVIAKLEGDAA